MDLTLLVQELQKPEYQGKSDQEAADIINAKTEVVRRPVSCATLKAFAIREGFYAAIEDSCTSDDLGQRRLCKNIKAWIDDIGGRLETVNMDDPKVQDMLVGLVGYSIVKSDEADTMLNMANVTVKWTELNDIGEIGIGLIQAARRLNG